MKPFAKLLAIVALFAAIAPVARPATEAATLPNGTGSPSAVVIDDAWHLWLDTKAEWKNDPLFLPDEVDLAKMPVNAPTGGWQTLSDQAGIPVTLPGTVEEYYWGKKPLPTGNPNWPPSLVDLNSPYLGVSWWYRDFTAPALKAGERLILSFPGARMRAEVYVNNKLVGYNVVTEVPFAADVTDALKSGGPNQLAVRITNPGGNFAWVDYDLTHWGKYAFFVSRGFGGIDGGVTLSVRGSVAVTDLFVANHPEPRTVTLHAEVSSAGPAYKGPVALTLLRAGKEVWRGEVDANVPAGGTVTVSKDVTLADAELWDIGHPNLYRAGAYITSIAHSARQTDFGFRWFNAEGLGSNARLALNGRRVVVKSAISWGLWAPNGIFPDQAAVQREVAAAQALGLNCVQTHRHFPKAAVLDGFDRAGLLRYCEPGGGGASFTDFPAKRYAPGPIDTSGTGGEATTFAQKYATVKLLSMIKTYRSHPAAIVWTVQNETGADLHNPRIFWILRKMRELDPTRIILLKSGYDPVGEVMGLPYTDTWAYGDPKSGNDSGWHDTHTCNDYQGVYLDQFYKGPTDYPYYNTEAAAISTWGEMATGASVDNVAAMARWYREKNVPGYDREAAEVLTQSYEKFLDEYHFRADYPTAETLFKEIGDKHYFSAARVMENARMADANDYIVLSGWESTTVDNHCGLVDALRQPKGDPELIREASAPERLVVRPLHYVVAKGQAAVADVHILNESNLHGAFTLRFRVAMDAAKDRPFFDTTLPVSVTGGEKFGELLKAGVTFTPPAVGAVTITAELVAAGSSTPVLTRTEPLLVVDPTPAPLAGPVACADFDGKLAAAVHERLGANGVPLASAPAGTGAILMESAGAPRFALDLNNVQRLGHAENTDDPGLYAEQSVGKKGDVTKITGLAPGKATVELFFADTYFNDTGKRVFDVALNGQTVLKDFDIVAASGGKSRATVQKVDVDCPQGVLTVSIPRIKEDKTEFAAIRVTDASGHITRQVFRRKAYTSPNGDVWSPVDAGGYPWAKTLPAALERVRAGSRLVMLTLGGDDAGDAASALADAGVIDYQGALGFDRTSWLGYWYFSRSGHWLLDGLPSGGVLDWQFQAAGGGDGLRLKAPGLEPVIAIGKNHSPTLGFGAVVIPCGKGQIVLFAIPGLAASFVDGNPDGFQPVSASRLIYNALGAGPRATR
ncbi:MAG TPA: malectin domain-containing carbohydrate-binding protein [Rariglobus sp.]|jgi:hypothetical protein|nr:malectin domain-containing carbohydrate-binding protein [Rariglobus sp.]